MYSKLFSQKKMAHGCCHFACVYAFESCANETYTHIIFTHIRIIITHKLSTSANCCCWHFNHEPDSLWNWKWLPLHAYSNGDGSNEKTNVFKKRLNGAFLLRTDWVNEWVVAYTQCTLLSQQTAWIWEDRRSQHIHIFVYHPIFAL